MDSYSSEIAGRIKAAAVSADKLIVRLDTLTNRIDTARANDNRELVEYYERQFAEASVEFMDGVETILDDWYALRGEARPPAEVEYIAPEMLDEIHDTVVSIVQGIAPASPRVAERAESATDAEPAWQENLSAGRTGPSRRLDVKG
jgi:hypothetical protein